MKFDMATMIINFIITKSVFTISLEVQLLDLVHWIKGTLNPLWFIKLILLNQYS